MGWYRRLTTRPVSEAKLDAELRFHLEQRIVDFQALGFTPEEARRQAQLEFGSLDSLKEECRDAHWANRLENLQRDLHYTVRALIKDRNFTLLAIFALALGIGSATVIFSAFYGVILNTFAFKNADQVTAFYIVDQDHPTRRRPNLTLPELVYYREHNHVFQDLSGEFGGFGQTPLRYTAGGSTYQFDGCYLSASSFELFGMKPLLGRLPTEDDVKPGASPVFVIGAKLWREHFNSDPSVVGRSFTLNGVPRLLVGVMPPRFRWAWVDAWLPFSLDPNEIASNPELKGQMAYTVGRLKAGVSLKEAAADLDLVAHQYARIEPRLYPKRFTVTTKRSSDEAVQGLGFSKLLYPLLAAVMLLLLIACGNVANLLLARATVRAREVAVRAALGASRGRLLWQFLIESLFLAIAGCAGGCLLAYLGIKLLVPLIPYNAFPQEAVIALNFPVLLFSLGMAALCTVVCGMAPAVQGLRGDLRSRLSSAGPGSSAVAAHGMARSALVVAEVALSVVLLVSAGLMMRTVFRLQHTDLGVNPQNLLTAVISFSPRVQQNNQERRVIFERFLEKLQTLPGVTAASPTAGRPPFAAGSLSISVSGKVHSDQWKSMVDLCGAGFLAALQQHVLQGRFLDTADVNSARRVAVINEAFARQYFGNENPIGRLVTFSDERVPPALKNAGFEVIGVVTNVRNAGFAQPPMPQMYLPYSILWMGQTTFVARTAVKPESLIPSVRQLVWSVDPNAALIDATSLESWLQKFVYANSQFEFLTLGSFAVIGLLLVLIGIFSVMAYTVALQTHEIGVRMALGAMRGRILQMVLRKGVKLIVLGMVIGVPVSLATTRVLAHQMQGVSFLDPWTYVGVLLLLVAAGAAACFTPAWRAARVDPLEAIRCE